MKDENEIAIAPFEFYVLHDSRVHGHAGRGAACAHEVGVHGQAIRVINEEVVHGQAAVVALRLEVRATGLDRALLVLEVLHDPAHAAVCNNQVRQSKEI